MATAIAEGITKGSQMHLERSTVEWNAEAKAIQEKINKDSHNASLWLELGLCLGEQALFREAIMAYSMGLTYEPFNSTLLRHRGHRYLSIGEVENFMADLTLCLRIDPKNWWAAYYLQEGFFVKGEFEMAAQVCRQCLELTGPDDYLISIVDWYWMALARQGKMDEANAILKHVEGDYSGPRPESYVTRVKLYRGEITLEEVEKGVAALTSNGAFCTEAYGLANYYIVIGEDKKADELLLEIIRRDEGCWQLSGYFCAVEEAKRRGLKFKL